MTMDITGPRISWLLLIVYYVYNDATTDLLEGPVSHGLKESMSVRLLEYLLRAWNEDERPPTSFEELCVTLTTWLLPSTGSSKRAAADEEQVDSLIIWLRTYWNKLGESDSIGLSGSAPSVIAWLDLVLENAGLVLTHLEMDGVPAPSETLIDRRSPIGMAIRRMRLAADSIDQMKAGKSLERQLRAWRDAELVDSTMKPNVKLSLPQQGALASRDDVFALYEDARFRGDYSTAKECIHRFFNYAPSTTPRGLPPTSRRKQLHHVALTNLASFHLDHDEVPAAREALKEAIQLARVEQDVQCLDILSSLKTRIEAADCNDQDKRPNGPTNRKDDTYWASILTAQQGVKQHLILDDLIRTMIVRPSQWFMATHAAAAAFGGTNPHAGQQAKSAANLPTGERPRQVISKNCLRPWVTMAHLASRMGDVQSAQRWRKLLREEPYHEKDDLRFPDELMMRFDGSYELAEEGRYEEGLSILVDRSIIEKMSLRQYHRWTLAIWKVLHLQALRMGDILTAKKIAQMATGKNTLQASDGPVDADYHSRLTEAKEFINGKEGIRAIPILESLFKEAEASGHFPMYRQSRVLYAKVLALELGLVQDALEVLEEIMSEILMDHNRERRGEASFVHAQVILASAAASNGSKATAGGGLDRKTTERAMTWMERARQDFYATSSTSPTPALLPVLFSLARLHDRLGDIAARDGLAQEYVSATKKIDALASGVGLGNARRQGALDLRVWDDLIARVGKRKSGL